MKKGIYFFVLLIVLSIAGYFAYQNRHYFITVNKDLKSSNQIEKKISAPKIEKSIDENENQASDELSPTAEEISQWIGDYYFETVEAQGEGEYLAILEFKIFEGDGMQISINSFYENLDHTNRTESASYFGSLKWKDNERKTLVYSHEVTAGEDNGLGDPEMEIFKKDEQYFLTFSHIVPEHKEWPIEFRRTQKK